MENKGIDLKELEEHLDSALNSETKESLAKWLNEKRCVCDNFTGDLFDTMHGILLKRYNGSDFVNNPETRAKIQADMNRMVPSEYYGTKCNEENNTCDVIELGVAVITIFSKDFYGAGLSYSHMLLGNKENFSKALHMLRRMGR